MYAGLLEELVGDHLPREGVANKVSHARDMYGFENNVMFQE